MVDKEVPLIKAKKTPTKDIILDKNGFFVIEIDKQRNKIRVEFYSNVYKEEKIVSGKLEKVFEGKEADALCDTIARHIADLSPKHYMYIGRELQRADFSLKNDTKYTQDGC